MKKRSKKKLSRDERPILLNHRWPDGSEAGIFYPPLCKLIRQRAREYNSKNGTHLSAAAFIVIKLLIQDHPVRALWPGDLDLDEIGKRHKYDQLDPGVLLPVPAEKARTI
ncbi:MAG TPA: hypothetical protein VIS96_16580 [Terrimicrobiaceae bacterium]